LASVASGIYSNTLTAMSKMNAVKSVIEPATGKLKEFHNSKFKVFLKMYEDFMSYRSTMNEFSSNHHH